MFKILVMVCSLAVSDNYCNINTATHVYKGPEVARMDEGGCPAQAKLFAGAVAEHLDFGTSYLRWVCAPMGADRSS